MPPMLTVLEGNCFLVADDHGDVSSGSEGLYYNDTRYLSRWRLLINGERPQLLSSDTVDYYSAAVFLQNPPMPGLPAGAVSLIRDLFVGEGGLQSTLHVENHLLDPLELELELQFDVRLPRPFEVKAREYREEDLVFTDRTQPRMGVGRARDDRENSWSFTLQDGGFRARRWSGCPARRRHENSITHRITLAPGESWDARAHVVLLHGQRPAPAQLQQLLLRPGAGAGGRVAARLRLHAPELSHRLGGAAQHLPPLAGRPGGAADAPPLRASSCATCRPPGCPGS